MIGWCLVQSFVANQTPLFLNYICTKSKNTKHCYLTFVYEWDQDREIKRVWDKAECVEHQMVCAITLVLHIMQLDRCAKGIWLLKCSLPQHWFITELPKCSALQHSQMSTTSEQTGIKNTHTMYAYSGGKTRSNGDNHTNSLSLRRKFCERCFKNKQRGVL